MSGIHLNLIADNEVPTPGAGEVFLFAGLDGRMRGKLAGGVIVDVLQGVQGAQGLPGAVGAAGATGAQGAQGLPGAAGATGAQGAQGLPGPVGAAGATGARGAQGLPGAVGAAGAAGATGAQGAQGLPGTVGAAGAAGAQGAQGLPGAVGAAGATGAQGAQGLPGAVGAPGAQGAAGQNGIKGDKGDAGATGAQGAGFDSFIELATIAQARTGAASLVIAAKPAGASLLNKMVRVRAVVDTNANSSVSFSLNCGGMVFQFPNVLASGNRKHIFEASALIANSVANSSSYYSLATPTVGGTASPVKGTAAVSGALASFDVVLTMASVGQTVTTRLAQIEVV